MSAGTELRKIYRELVEKVDELERKIDDAANSAIARILHIAGVIRELGDAVITRIRNDVLEPLNEFVETIEMGDVLKSKRQGWKDISKNAGDVSDRMDSDLVGKNYWHGIAKQFYVDALDVEKKQVGKFSPSAVAIDGTLDTVGSAVDDAGWALVAAAASLVVALGSAVASATPALPLTLPLAAAAVGAFLTALIAAGIGLKTLNTSQSTAAHTLETQMNEQGEWKKPSMAVFSAAENWIDGPS